MSDYTVTLKPVYSCPAIDVPKSLYLPNNWSLSWNQLETWKAIKDPSIDVIFNTSMTGDGKSLSVYLDSMQGQQIEGFTYPMALYPTNELARDQERQIQGYINQFKPNNDPRITRLSGASLEIYAETEDIKKETAIATKIQESEIILTNPDIYHYLHRHAYLMFNERPNKLWSALANKFKLLIHDEFHVLSAPQIASIINTMLLVRKTKGREGRKYIFLSATPEPELIERLDKVGFNCHPPINPYAEGKYKFPDTEEEMAQLESDNWRPIARKIILNFIPLESSYQASENWLLENKNLILDLFQNYPYSKGAIILNSLAAVKRLKPKLAEFLYPLKVAENTGLTGQADKEKSLEADLILGTSTIDVGVDFKINFLIYESSDAGNFIQRLGRLGRHDGYEKDGKFIPFNKFVAYTLVPNFLVEKLFKEDSPPLEIEGIYERPFFHEQIKEKYRKINNFQGYYSRWAGVQSVFLSYQLSHKTIKQQYEASRAAFQEDCEKVFNTKFGRIRGCIKRWTEEWRELSRQTQGNPIVEDASSFRSSSSLSCGLYDLTETWEVDRFKTYDLPGILSNLEIEPMTKTAYLQLLKSTAARLNTPIPKGRFNYCLGFMKLLGYREGRLQWRFIYPGDLKEISDRGKVQVLLGIQVLQPGNRWITDINKRLKNRGLVSYVVSYPVEEVKRRLQLPMHFQIYPIDEGGRDNMTAPYSIAFGQSALLLDTLAYRLRGKGDELWIC